MPIYPLLVAQIEFAEWAENDHLRHSKFVGIRDAKDAMGRENEARLGE
jgi:ATP-dependent DNA ligase